LLFLPRVPRTKSIPVSPKMGKVNANFEETDAGPPALEFAAKLSPSPMLLTRT